MQFLTLFNIKFDLRNLKIYYILFWNYVSCSKMFEQKISMLFSIFNYVDNFGTLIHQYSNIFKQIIYKRY